MSDRAARQAYFPGTDLDAAEKLAREGCRAPFMDAEFGIVVFGGDRVRAEELVSELPPQLHGQLTRDWDDVRVRSLDHLRALFCRHGSARGSSLVDRIRNRRA